MIVDFAYRLLVGVGGFLAFILAIYVGERCYDKITHCDRCMFVVAVSTVAAMVLAFVALAACGVASFGSFILWVVS